MTKREQVIKTLEALPHLNKWQIAERVGCTAAYVSQITTQWRRDKEWKAMQGSQVEMFPVAEQVCMPRTDSIDAVLTERGSRYGNFEDHARITQAIKHEIRQGDSYTKMEDDMVEALDMIAHKIGRIVNGDPRYADSWVDIAGYAKLVADRLLDDEARLAKLKEERK